MKRKAKRNRPTKRMVAARVRLVEAATELACHLGTGSAEELRLWLMEDEPTVHFAHALADIYNANDEWQEAQLRGRG